MPKFNPKSRRAKETFTKNFPCKGFLRIRDKQSKLELQVMTQIEHNTNTMNYKTKRKTIKIN